VIRVSSAFEGGNVEVIDLSERERIQLRIRRDAGGRFLQWFYFRVSGAKGEPLVMHIENAHEATYARGWNGYSAVCSADRERWVRVPTEYDGRALTIRHTPEADSAWYAYFAPYSLERHADCIARWQESPRARLEVLGATLDGQDLDCIHAGTGPREVWLIARQHPGETMAEWLAEGFLDRLLDDDDALARELLERASFHVVPNMNPDGSRRGHLRTNAAGENLNRAWLAPTMSASPEVALVRERMHATGVDLCVDVHGDEVIPHNFVAGPEGTPSFGERQRALLDAFRATWALASPDFSPDQGYPPTAPGEANLRLCTNYVAETFGCLAVTIEQPFKDTARRPNPLTGWSPARARRLGASVLDPIAAVLRALGT
jgi:murein tripeptide amidase MpaA